ncbi:uncharacterized protein LOC128988186 isoform X2 [Macrosteles quadrilineatus]|uniref:uncharacterized protein LOC128982142 isoform X2 n=1 Tax=Macrosteles quadrilineatus TaxID=74068 RepID=UPI0023E262D0|nr:uncharacterized protein LOC128982142 isoform X2 [Macrosteles quadrilineatus]XP_054265408.1 uncharacterized protein LOC128988186 isoform X2 [Macrosteles quadrilineatus]
MRKQQITGWCMLAVLGCSMVNPVLGYPSVVTAAHLPDNSDWKPYAPAPVPAPAPDAAPEARKFAEKPNASKKVIALEDRNDIDDIQTNQISDAGFSWSNMLAMVMQMLFNPIGSQQVGPNKSDSIDTDQGISPSPWANLLTMGLKILTAILGGGGAPQGDGIDKVDNSSPMQFINIVVNLLDALKTSFSHRSIAARSIGRKDSVSEAAVASLSLLKGYVRTMKTTDDNCHEKYICEANNECANSMNGSSTIYCQLSTYAASFLLQRTGEAPFDKFYEAGRRGRSGDDCRQLYLTCNEV